MKEILIIDDEREMLESLDKILSRNADYKLFLMSDPEEALKEVKTNKYDLIITDLKLKNVSGLDVMKAVLSVYPETPVIMISGYGTIDASVDAMREGAFDFVEKPFTSKRLFDCIERAFRQKFAHKEDIINKKKSNEKLNAIIYQSEVMEILISTVKKISPGNMNVIITGESGSGKELIARAIHNLSKRSLEPFVPVNCGALPEALFESELFGHERGAFTGAVKTKPGLLEFANHGTFFLDEISEMSLSLQVKLLRMLEDKKIRRVGGQQEIEIDVRIIAATNVDLEKAVAEKKFREDLFYRLTTMQIELPPLRKRTTDILPIANHFLSDLNSKNDKIVRGFSSEAEQAMLLYSWPGNVRELQNIISRAYFLSTSSVIQKADLPIQCRDNDSTVDEKLLSLKFGEAKEHLIENFEVNYLTYHLKQNDGNITKTAEVCGIDRRTIHRLINKYNIVYQ
ncbi:MAG: sigma-54 dependent transcriptional regulator [Melioribacteraceae bacterium]|nr:sigma-54 dependent transcriptional regulator [Melioribacteraceae bacterium]MCF8353136.1 sigma-54 dependent transcriptional regulator [Melioribacteraceae bacterium]MCF8396160.1 sigma-54 dependent transcriptional regulator [Melioribacteraceae bacterium]MCF8418249.1 sigma-54 dependent transcriptional regulator [Melioribacteraceae bacterium]